MSFKAHDGFRLDEKVKNKSMGYIKSCIDEVKKDAKEKFDEKFTKELLVQTIGNGDFEDVTDISYDFREKFAELNMQVNIALLPSFNETLVLPFAYNNKREDPIDSIHTIPFINEANNIIINYLSESDYFEYYGYWDNTDPDENCSEKEWACRKREWNNAVGFGEPISALGFIYSMYEINYFNFHREINDKEYNIDVNKRAWNKALTLSIDENVDIENDSEGKSRAVVNFMLKSNEEDTEENNMVKNKMDEVTLPPIYFRRDILISEGWNWSEQGKIGNE